MSVPISLFTVRVHASTALGRLFIIYSRQIFLLLSSIYSCTILDNHNDEVEFDTSEGVASRQRPSGSEAASREVEEGMKPSSQCPCKSTLTRLEPSQYHLMMMKYWTYSIKEASSG